MSERLYAQLKPDHQSLRHLLALQHVTPPRGRTVQPERLHLTVIHFGIISDVLRKLPGDPARQAQALHEYINRSQEILHTYKDHTFELSPINIELFGEFGRTLVMTYAPSAALNDLHDRLVTTLRQFFSDCGVADVNGFMTGDSNFKHALTIQPHITLMKGYVGNVPVVSPQPVRLRTMKLLYDE